MCSMRLQRRAVGIFFVALLAATLGLEGCAESDPSSDRDALSGAQTEGDYAELIPAHTYELEGSFEVDGRQGVAIEGDRIWVSGSTTLSRYDVEGQLQATNERPFDEGYDEPVNHIGDIDVYDGEVFCGVELFEDGVASHIQIAVYDGETLRLKRTFGFDPESGQDECSGICVDADTNSVWMCSWTATGRYLYRYDLKTGAYLGRVQLHASPQWIQGVAYHDGSLYLTADDGDADYDEPDHVYRVSIADGATHAFVGLERTFDDVARQGEVEGLTFSDDGHMLVLYNRGARIVLGMPTGFYDGYTEEVHEVYAYRMSKATPATR